MRSLSWPRLYNPMVKSSGRKQVEGPVHLIEAAMQHVSEAVVITTTKLAPPDPEIVYVNEGFCRMSGYAAEEVIARRRVSFRAQRQTTRSSTGCAATSPGGSRSTAER